MGGLCRPPRPPCAALAGAHHRRGRVLQPLSAQRHARRPRQRLPAHGAGQGPAPPRALIKHGLRTALIPMATFFAYQFALLFVGATFTEKIFGWHGMGEFFVDSVTKNDVNSVAAVTLFVARAGPDRRLSVRRRLRGTRPAGPRLTRCTSPPDPAKTAAASSSRRPSPSPPRPTTRSRVAARAPPLLRKRLRDGRPGRWCSCCSCWPSSAPTSSPGSTTSSTSTRSCRRPRPSTGSAPRRTASTCSR